MKSKSEKLLDYCASWKNIEKNNVLLFLNSFILKPIDHLFKLKNQDTSPCAKKQSQVL